MLVYGHFENYSHDGDLAMSTYFIINIKTEPSHILCRFFIPWQAGILVCKENKQNLRFSFLYYSLCIFQRSFIKIFTFMVHCAKMIQIFFFFIWKFIVLNCDSLLGYLCKRKRKEIDRINNRKTMNNEWYILQIRF